MMETAKKIFKVGIYGQIQKMIDFLEKRYNISNGWLNFSYTVEEFPDDFKKTCYYLGLKSDTKVFGVNCMLGGKKKALMVISPPNCNMTALYKLRSKALPETSPAITFILDF